jgi:hypothetical protein
MPDFEQMTEREIQDFKRDIVYEIRELREQARAAQLVLEAKRAASDAKWAKASRIATSRVGGGDLHSEETETLYALPDDDLDALDTGPLTREQRRAMRDARIVVASVGASANVPVNGTETVG